MTGIDKPIMIEDAPIQQMTVDVFWKLGFIQEINRQLLHPCGLAISVLTDDDGNATGFGEIWDYRSDPEGIYYAPDQEGKTPISLEKYHNVKRLITDHSVARKKTLGYVIQPPQ